ncbi:MAG: hypothetical protein A3J07_02770 [Candidatus Doudnabacteria bacterium RIFCSPLOWO2_02_FULL_49_13]|uniref:DUF5671 domain-containing protein n=1 Tax=Candidatus Doudnabacteria bacterium RIFCSPHIGHO2_12_FULL_48_16 TaxID=1817838 RepID=A0A1F5PLP6_9BACT|nr:MAG: hypothetical protein A3B77_01410 [Candidatus Doudnabacteria bacterium RIFCSPHIGHO2_02_FULL_49_24]OGE88117.1 MAG: hypothetical protein A2760_00915 [Candidatus Doudnabacteria bacterium RIFCSPHIGHO2_01_FULL_50_67]OGE90600.1 MAG: hypothetical protein A3E29_02280 [Candidatus Doudnabacteria bacterium RIFCSPHIGHO2_12_FULL_48_16]OGE96476.1 MAG: hypothetical protein A2990_04315 [Candidatus Doudnabacteria bacterium RIFCSPLOWO2_01_FULL_49_40]OGF02993.1 MAG: hypothetical protein A3J07_02770 [Candid
MALNLTLRKVYLYLFAIIGLVLLIMGAVSLIDLGLKTYVFTKSDYPCYYDIQPMSVDKSGVTLSSEDQQKRCQEQRTSDKQRQASTALAQIIVGLPLYLYHWVVIRKENQV